MSDVTGVIDLQTEQHQACLIRTLQESGRYVVIERVGAFAGAPVGQQRPLVSHAGETTGLVTLT
jgi:hypothetical protein